MKIEQAIVLYLLKNKNLSLQGIGTFKIDGAFPEPTDDKPFIIPAESVSFNYDPKTQEDEDLIDFIVQNTKKIKPLASADLYSYLTLGRQFLNIGKPFTIQNLGTLEKSMDGEYEFKAGPVVQKIENQKIVTDATTDNGEENLFNDYQTPRSSGNGRTLLYLIVIILLAAAGWASWKYLFKKNNSETSTSNTADSIVPIHDSTSVVQKIINDSLAKVKIADSIKNAQKNPADSFTFKIVIRETTNDTIAQARAAKLKSFGRKVIVYTNDSITYKVAEPFTLPLSDTTKILDSLNKYYYRGKAHVETK